MKIVIDIPEELLTENMISVDVFPAKGTISDVNIFGRYADFTVLPKGHGRITDLDEIIRFTYATYGIGSGKSITEDNKDLIEYIYNDAPVLVEADKEA